MKQSIEYYYGIKVIELKQDHDSYFFEITPNRFYFVKWERPYSDINQVIEMGRHLKEIKLNCHDLIRNRFQKLVTNIEGTDYVLMKITPNYQREYSLVEMLELNQKTRGRFPRGYKINWKELWMAKIDYFESQVRDFGKTKLGILNTFSYYVGLAENAVLYLNDSLTQYNFNPELDNICICHRRIFIPNYELNYLNPLSFIIDLEVRDYAEYFKAAFFQGEDIRSEFISFLKIKRLTSFSYHLLYARLLFPSYYFDVYEKIIHDEINEDALITIVNRSSDYEQFLKFAYSEIRHYSLLKKVPWL